MGNQDVLDDAGVDLFDDLDDEIEIDAQPAADDARPAEGEKKEEAAQRQQHKPKTYERFVELNKRNRALETRIAKQEGMLEMLARQAPTRPEPDVDPAEEAEKLQNLPRSVQRQLQQLGDGQNKLQKMLLEQKASDASQKAIDNAMRGMKLSEEDTAYARRQLARTLKAEPDMAPEDLRIEAIDLWKRLGGRAALAAAKKKAAADATARPSGAAAGAAAGTAAGAAGGQELTFEQKLKAAREKALTRLSQAKT